MRKSVLMVHGMEIVVSSRLLSFSPLIRKSLPNGQTFQPRFSSPTYWAPTAKLLTGISVGMIARETRCFPSPSWDQPGQLHWNLPLRLRLGLPPDFGDPVINFRHIGARDQLARKLC